MRGPDEWPTPQPRWSRRGGPARISRPMVPDNPFADGATATDAADRALLQRHLR